MNLASMEIPSVYIETTVVSYLTARPSRDLIVAAHQRITLEWWKTALPRCRAFVSPIVIQEASRGDPNAARRRLESIADFPVLEVTEDVNALAGEYFARTRIPEKARADTFHLSLATLHGMDYLLSWNFTHILGRTVRRIVQGINTILCLFLAQLRK